MRTTDMSKAQLLERIAALQQRVAELERNACTLDVMMAAVMAAVRKATRGRW